MRKHIKVRKYFNKFECLFFRKINYVTITTKILDGPVFCEKCGKKFKREKYLNGHLKDKTCDKVKKLSGSGKEPMN